MNSYFRRRAARKPTIAMPAASKASVLGSGTAATLDPAIPSGTVGAGVKSDVMLPTLKFVPLSIPAGLSTISVPELTNVPPV